MVGGQVQMVISHRITMQSHNSLLHMRHQQTQMASGLLQGKEQQDCVVPKNRHFRELILLVVAIVQAVVINTNIAHAVSVLGIQTTKHNVAIQPEIHCKTMQCRVIRRGVHFLRHASMIQ